MKKLSIFLLYFLTSVYFAGAEMFDNDYLKTIEVEFYYNNSISYTDVGRTIPDIVNGFYDIKRVFFYEDLRNFKFLEKILQQTTEIIKDDRLQKQYEKFVDSFCRVRINSKLVIEFTYSKSNDIYCLCNGNLIKRNKIYDDFVEYLIQIIDKK